RPGRGPARLTAPRPAALLSPPADAWSSVPAPPGLAIEGRSATLLRDGTVLVVGGTSGRAPGALAETSVFDPRSSAWAPVAPTGAAHSQHSATLLPDGRVLVAGGAGPIADTEVFEPAARRWSRVGSLA